MSTHRCLVVKQMIKMKIPHPPLCARVTLLHCLFVCTCIFLRLLCVLVLWDQQVMPAVVLAMQPSKSNAYALFILGTGGPAPLWKA